MAKPTLNFSESYIITVMYGMINMRNNYL
jgi:hypothetical protein